MSKHPDLRSIRQAKKLTLAELAGRLGITISYVSHLETGFRKVNDDLVKRLADSLNVTQKAIREAAEQIEYDKNRASQKTPGKKNPPPEDIIYISNNRN